MEPFYKITAEFVKLTLKIIESAVRAVLETAVEVAAIGFLAVTGAMLGYLIVRWNCLSEECCSTRCMGSVVMVAGWAFLALAAYAVIKRMH